MTLGLSHLETSVEKKTFELLKVGTLLGPYISFAIFFHLHFKTLHAYLLCKLCPICDIGKMFCQLLTPKMTAILILSSQMSSRHLPISSSVNAMGIHSFFDFTLT